MSPALTALRSEVSALDRFSADIEERMRAIMDRRVSEGAASYDRNRVLPKLMRVSAAELADTSEDGRTVIVERLERVLRAHQNAVRTGHWSSSRRDVAGVRVALDAERAALAELTKGAAA